LGDAISGGVKTAASTVSDAMRGASATSAAGSDMDSERRLQWGGRDLIELLERQPLALAILGVATGAAIATAFPKTAAEDQLLGTTGETLRETANTAVSTAGDAVAAAVDAVIDEAVAQNLTPEGAKQAMKAGASKLKNIVEAAVQTTAN
jgi:hypothetical protein